MKDLIKAAAWMLLACGVALAQSATAPASAPGTSQTQAQPAAPQSSNQTSTPSTSEEAAASPGHATHATRIAPGSVIPVQLTKTVDAKKAKTGQEVVAKVTQDMKTQSGEVLVPKDTKVIGHVTEAQPRTKEQKESQLAIAFDHAVTKDGKDMQMPMSIQAVIGQQANQQSEANTPAGKEEAAGVPSGAAPTNAGTPRAGSNGGPPPPSPAASASASNEGSATQSSRGGLPPINAQTTGVIGMSNVTLSPASNGAQGSVITSDKNNVKLESGTMLLLKVNR